MSDSSDSRRFGLKPPQDKPTSREPLWKGPEVGGITFSLLSRFLVCRERFRLYAIEGLTPAPAFNHRLEFGNMWHICEDFTSQGQSWEGLLRDYARDLCRTYPLQQEQIDHWYNVVKVTFPLYVEHWQKHPDQVQRRSLLQEQVFRVPYTLPSGRIVTLRGKWDSVDLIGKGQHASIYLQENKTKGDINEVQIKRQLTFDLQTMLYLVALSSDSVQLSRPFTDVPFPTKGGLISGVMYNVIRRPLSGGKGTIVRHKPTKTNPAGESKEHYYARLAEIIREDLAYYFMRWKVEVITQDIQRFRRECLDPILEQLCDWWEYTCAHGPIHDSYEDMWSFNKRGTHFRYPYGVWNPLAEGLPTELDDHLATGTRSGLVRAETLFPELS